MGIYYILTVSMILSDEHISIAPRRCTGALSWWLTYHKQPIMPLASPWLHVNYLLYPFIIFTFKSIQLYLYHLYPFSYRGLLISSPCLLSNGPSSSAILSESLGPWKASSSPASMSQDVGRFGVACCPKRTIRISGRPGYVLRGAWCRWW